MYHTFTVTSPPARAQAEDGTDQPRISTSTACVECRRKKTRCGGGQPCQQCTWIERPELCKYTRRARKVMPSRSLVEQLQRTIDQQSIVCRRLFPEHQIADLVPLDREQLRHLVLSQKSYSDTSPAGEPSSPGVINPPAVPSLSHQHQASQDWSPLDTLDQAPELDAASNEITRHRSAVHGVSDDVNGLSLSHRTNSSYVGVSSVNAALKAIFKIAPQVQVHLAQHCPRTAQPSRAPSPSLSSAYSVEAGSEMGQYALPPPDIAEKHIDSYFEHIHALMPMIDEDAFRQSFLYDQRMDVPWLALFNVVLALGSLASGTSYSNEHLTYAKRAQQILSQKSLGSNNLLILQAHGLLSGYYMHWLNLPNEAHAMMGATMRIASAVGLHREYDVSSAGNRAVIPPEVRRRTWWSLVCLDTWASMTTGRPSFGRLGPGVTVKHPSLPPSTNNKEYLASLKLLPLVHNLAFCTLATRVQDLLATKPLLSLGELDAEDAKLVEWHDNLPPILRNVLPKAQHTQTRYNHATNLPPDSTTTLHEHHESPEDDSCPALLQKPRAFMHWSYLNLRFLMHRPYLIAASLSRVPEADLPEQNRYAIQKCRILAGQAITTIDRTCQDNLIAGWNAVWLMYQAVMVPLLSLSALYTGERTASDGRSSTAEPANAPSDEELEWQAQIQTAIGLFERMSSFSLAAVKSKLVVEQLLHACKLIRAPASKGPESKHSHVLPDDECLVGGSQDTLENTDFGTLDLNVHDLDMDLLWDDMAWESMSGTFDNMPFANPQARDFEDIFDL